MSPQTADALKHAVEHCEAEITRELGPLSLAQHIALCRALDRLADEAAAATRAFDDWGYPGE
jgi:hypothetical protein